MHVYTVLISVIVFSMNGKKHNLLANQEFAFFQMSDNVFPTMLVSLGVVSFQMLRL